MKQVQRDSKYIIKRILIGVGIALILANLRKCNVYADTTNNIYLKSYGMGYHNIISNTSFSNYYDLYSFEYLYNNISFNFNIQSDSDLSDKKYVFFHKKNSDIYVYNYLINNNYNSSFDDLYYTSNSCGYGICPSFKTSLNTYENGFFGGFSILPIDSSNNEVLNYMYQSNYSTSYDLSNLNNNYNIKLISWNNELSFPINNSNFFNDFEIISSNFNNIYYENDIIYSSPPDINNLTKIDLIDNQAVYFVPKNYETINKEQLDNIDFINFSFYYKGNLKTGFYNLKDNSQIVFNYTTPLLSESDYTFFDINFPLYYNSKTTDLCSIIFFNNNSVNSSIYYDSTLFDAYIINNMGSYDNTISIIDENGDPQDLDIHFNKTFQEQWEAGFLIGGEDFLTYFSQEPLHKFFDLIKLPFNFIENLKDSTCSPIVLPVPFTNSEIRLNCLSSTFSSVLGNYYSTLRMLISGIVLYHTFLLNFYCLLDIIKPKTSFEVVDL